MTFKKKVDENYFLSFTSVFQQVTVKSVKVEFEFFHPEKPSTRNSRNTKKWQPESANHTSGEYCIAEEMDKAATMGLYLINRLVYPIPGGMLVI